MSKNLARALAVLLTAPTLLAALSAPALAAPLPPYSNWQTPVPITTPGLPSAFTVAVLPEANDSFLAIYFEEANGTETFYSRSQSGSTGLWGLPEFIDAMPPTGGACTNAVVLPDGRIFFLYTYGPALSASFRVAPYAPGSGWGSPMTLTNDTGGRVTSCPRAEVERDGSLTVAWLQSTGSFVSAWQRFFDPTTGWQDAALLENEDLGNVIRGPSITSDGAGNFTAAWTQSNGTATGVFASERGPGGGWTARRLLQSAPFYNATTLSLRYLGSGKTLAVWNQTGPPTLHLWSALLDGAAGWQAPVAADTSGREPLVRSLVPSGRGGAVVLWTTQAGTNQLWSSPYTTGAGWGTPVRVDASDAGGVAVNPPYCLADTPDGAWCFWSQFNGSVYDVWGARFDPASGWKAPALLDLASGNATVPIAVAYGSGNLTLLWAEERPWGSAIMSRCFVPSFGWTNATPVLDNSSWDAGTYGEAAASAPDGTQVVLVDAYDWFNGTSQTLAVSGVPYRVANPWVTISSPADGTITALPSIEVVGATERGLSVAVNGVAANQQVDGSFRLAVPIVAGNNTITVVATHPLGFSTAVRLNVVVRDLSSQTQQQVAALLAALDAETAAVAAQQDRIDGLNAQFGALLNETQALAAKDNASGADLAAVRAQLNATKAELDVGQADLALTSAQLNVTLAKLDLVQAELALDRVQQELTDLNASGAQAQAAAAEQKARAADDRAAGAASSVALLTGVSLAALAVAAVSLGLGLRGRRGGGGGGGGGGGSGGTAAGAKSNPMYEEKQAQGQNPMYDKDK